MSSRAAVADQQRALLAEVAEVEALKAQLYARESVLRAQMNALWNPPSGVVQEQFGVLELAGTARIGQTRASSQLINGSRLVEDLPGTLEALLAGRMFRENAVLLLELTRHCTSEVVRELERRALPIMITANTAEVRRLVLRLIPEVEADLDPALTERRLAEAQERQRVWTCEREQGLCGVNADLDPISARRWALDFELLCRAQKIADDRAGVVRTADQRRAALFAQLPSQLLALLHAIRDGKTEQLLALALADPDLADNLEHLAATLPLDEPGEEPLAEPEEPEWEEPSEAELEDRLGMLLDEAEADRGWCSNLLPPEPSDREPEPDPAVVGHWTDLSLLELASTVIGLPVKNPVVLNVHTQMSTLLTLDNRAGILEGGIDGGGTLPASIIRQLLPHAALRRVFTDPDSGIPIGIDPTIIPAPRPANARPVTPARTAPDSASPDSDGRERLEALLSPFELREQAEPRHDPSRRLRQLIELRDQHCTGPGCSQPAARCHLDHETPYPQGPTAAWNLSAKSARCHRAKHAGWTVTRHGPGPQHGHSTWTSPLGHSYTSLNGWLHPTPPIPAGIHEIDIGIHLEIENLTHAA